MATRLKRSILGAIALVALAGGTAGAQTADSFSSPVSVPAGQPFWVRSIAPCPAPTAGVSSVVVARIVDEVTAGEVAASATAVRSDGSWDATISAPAGPLGDGTLGYLVEAQCLTRPQTADAEATITKKYPLRRLEVTSGAASSGFGWIDGDVGGTATTTTTTTAPPTTTTAPTSTTVTTAATTSTTAATTLSAAGIQTANQPSSSTEDIQAEIIKKSALEEVRREAAAAVVDSGVALNASPASAARNTTPDQGIPAWAFACAAMLAVGAVVAWGQRRSAAVELVASDGE